MKIIKINNMTYMDILTTMSNNFNMSIRDIETMLKSIIRKEGVKNIIVDSEYDKDIIEFANDKTEDFCELYNKQAFVNDYKIKIKNEIASTKNNKITNIIEKLMLGRL